MTRTTGFWRRVLSLMAALVILAGVGAAPAFAQAPKRVALVIGNGAYATAGALSNARNDMTLVSGALKRAGFTAVTTRTDLSTQAFQKALREFQAQADGAEVALIYYAGHGIEAKGVNWLIPVDATLSDERALPYEAIDTNLALEAVAGARVRILLLDACRDNPFGRTWKSGTRSVTRGLARVEADDVLIVFAAAPGERAADGSGANSPFAEAVARAIPKPGVPVQLLGGVIRDDVMGATGQQQRPFVSASMTGEPIFLVAGSTTPAPVATPVAAPAPTVVADNPELTNWKSAERLNTVAGYQAYLIQYPSGAYAAMARAAITTLKGPPPQLANAGPGQTGGRTPAGRMKPNLAAAGGGAPAAGGVTRPFDNYMAGRAAADRGDHAAAARLFMLSLRNWPKQNWAPDAAASAALALAEDKRPAEACRVLAELPTRYPQRAAGVSQRADHARRVAGGCGG
jgi:uncharacterized caspase-like protein